jgi:TP901 family phage tail tape measure protein
MGSGQIKRSEIAESDLYKEIRDSAQKTIQQLDLMNASLKQSAEIIKNELSVGLEKTTKGIQNVTKASMQSEKIMQQSIKTEAEKTKLQKEMLKADQEIEKLNQQKQKTEQQKLRTQTQLNRETERQTKQNERLAKQTKDQNDAYKQLVIQTRDAKNESKRLGAEMLKLEQSGRKNTAEYRKLEQQYRKVTQSAQQGDKQLKKLDQTVGDNFRNVGNYRSALGKLTGALSSLGLAFGSAMVIRNVFNVVKDFDQAQANLSSVLGVTRVEMTELTETAKRLGATTKFTASQVSELQLEFAKLGFSQSEINDVTDATLQLASASGTDLANAAAVVGANVRAFGLSTLETQRVVDVMAKSFTSSSLDIEKFSTALAIVGPVAKSSGRTIEETTALIGTLTDRGIDASTAGTGLRNVFLELAKSGMTFEQAMDQINNATDKNAVALDLFGKRGAVIGTILAETGDDVALLTEKLNNAGGSAETMALKQLDTLSGSLDILNSAWEGYILGASESGGVTDTLKNFIQTLAENLETILDVIVNVGKMWIWYKGVTLAQIGVNKILASSFLQGAKNMGIMRGATQVLGNSIRQLGSFIKTNIVGIALMGIMELVREFSNLNTIAGTTSKAMDDIAESQSKLANESAKEVRQVRNLFSALRDTNPESKERLNLMNTINSKYKTTLGNYASEIEFLNAIAEAEQNLINQIKQRTELKRKQIGFEMLSTEMAKIQFEVDKSAKAIQQFYKGSFGEQALKNLFDKFGATGIGELQSIFDAWQTQLDEITPLFEIARDDYEKALLGMEKAGESVEIPLFPTGDDDEEKAVEKFIDRIKKIALKEKAIDDLLSFAQPDAQSSLDERLKTQTESIERELQQQTIKLKQQLLDRQILEKEHQEKLKKQLLNGEISQIEYEEQIQKLLKNRENNLQEHEEKIIQLQIESLEKQRELLEDYEKDVTDINEKILDKKLELLKKQEKQTEETTEKETKIIKLTADEQIRIVESLTESFERLADRRIDKLDQEMTKAQQRFDLYSELAKSGNINAQQSLAEEQRIIDEAQRKRDQIEKQKQRVQLVSSALQSYIRNTENPDVKNPLVKTISDVSLLTQFISSLPAFEKGIEDTGKNGTGVDGKGGFLSVLHPNERVLTKEQNSKVGAISNDELSNLALKFRNGELQSVIHKTESKQNPESNEIVNRLKSLEQTIRNKPETNIELERIVDGAMTILKTTTSGNTKVFNRYRTQR